MRQYSPLSQARCRLPTLDALLVELHQLHGGAFPLVTQFVDLPAHVVDTALEIADLRQRLAFFRVAGVAAGEDFLVAVNTVLGVVDAAGALLDGVVVLGDPLLRVVQGLALLVAEQKSSFQLRRAYAPVIVAPTPVVVAVGRGAEVVEAVFVTFLVGGLVGADSMLGAGLAVALVLVAARALAAFFTAQRVPVGAQAFILVESGAAGEQGCQQGDQNGVNGAHGGEVPAIGQVPVYA